MSKDIEIKRYIIEMFEEIVVRCLKKIMIIFEDREYIYEFMNE